MYRIIVVDDEPWSLIGLRKIIEGDADRFELLYETGEPLDALEQICEREPDAVFTDVRMPEISGIGLMRVVKERGVKTEFVVISGFAEFDYVQQAMREGAVDYLLKPFDRKKVGEALDRLYDKLENRRQTDELEFYSRLKDPKENIAHLLQSKFKTALYQKFQIVLTNYRTLDFGKKQMVFEGNTNTLRLKIGPRKVLYIINSDGDRTQEIYENLEKIEDEIENAAMSRSGGSAGMFLQLLNEAENALRDVFVYPENKIFQYRKPQRHIMNELKETIDNLGREQKYHQIEALIANFSQIFIDRQLGVADVLSLYNEIVLAAGKQGKELECVDHYEFTDKFADIQEMSAYLNTIYSNDGGNDAGTVNDKFRELVRYIEQHYAENISLSQLCKDFYINVSYCCELFKRHNGMTFSQYLTDIRIRKACELLRDYGMSVSQACDMVGYKDYFYFNRVFKKKTGYTPSEYRKMDAEGNH